MKVSRSLMFPTTMTLILVILPTIPVLSAQTSPETRMYLEPSNYVFDTSNATIGTKFNVTVLVAGVPENGMFAFCVCIHYRDDIINVTRWFEPTWDSTYVFFNRRTLPVPTPPTYSYAHTDPYHGSAHIGTSLFPATPPPFVGSGLLCIFEFNITAIPRQGETLNCTLHIDTPEIALLDEAGNIIPCRKEDGYYEMSYGYYLKVDSSPTGVTFVVNGASHMTPWSWGYVDGTSVSLAMPEIHTIVGARYYWSHWSDGVTSRSRTVTMNTNITLTGYFTGPCYKLAVTSLPTTGIIFTINGIPQATPYTKWLLEGSHILEMPETHDGYVWSHWLEDRDTNRTKTITLSGLTTWTGVYALLGDLNYDGRVDMQDIYIVIQAFGSYPSHPRWNPTADINKDNRVDMKDIYLVITNFGKTT